jgi:hypothetical protein
MKTPFKLPLRMVPKEDGLAIILEANGEYVGAPGLLWEQDKAEALAAARVILEKFGQAPAAAPASSPAKDNHKTMGDVADKALDISTKYIGQVASVLEKAAPHVYKVMIRQQIARAIGNVIGPIVLLLALLMVVSILRHVWKEPARDRLGELTDEGSFRVAATLVVPIIAAVILCIVLAIQLSDSVMYLINPEYYAIKDLVAMLLHPSTLAVP